MYAASVIGTLICGGDTQTLLAVYKFFALSGSRHAKPSRAGPHAQALELVTRHLVKIALLNISISFNRYNVFEDIRFKLKAQEKKLLITIAFLKLKPSCPFLYHDVAEN